MEENKNVVQLSEETFNTLMHYQGARGYRQGVQDSIRGMRIGTGIVLVGLLGAIVIDALIEKHKERKQAEEVSE